MSGESDLLDKLAQSIADGASVNWEEIDRLPADGELRRFLKLLRVVADVAEVHRSLGDVSPATDDVTTKVASGQPPPADADAGAPQGGLGQWGHLVLLRKIGEGAFGQVYHAHDTWLDHPVALKLFKPKVANRNTANRILHEARKLARIRHPNVVIVHGADSHNGQVGFWMDLIEGDTLEKLVLGGRLSPGEATYIGQEVCRALAAVHHMEIVHRDVKAQNVMRASDGGRIILMDFGAGEFIKEKSASSRGQGTPLYLAPEVFAGKDASVQSDIYAVGVLLYYLVTGDFPVRGSSVADLIAAHGRGERRRLLDGRPDLPSSFVSIVERAIDPDPARRFASAGEMEAALTGGTIPNVGPIDIRKVQGVEKERTALQKTGSVGLIAAAVVTALTALSGVLGFVACRAFEVILHIDQDFSATAGDYFTIGRQALIPFVAYSVVPAGVFAVLAGARLLLRSRMKKVWTRWDRWKKALDPTGVAIAILLLGTVCWIAITRAYYGVFVALFDLHQAPTTASVAGISLSSRSAHLQYGIYSAYLAFILVLAAFRWLPRLERCCDDPSTVRLTRWATLGVAILVLTMVTLPRRFVFERFEVVRLGNQRPVVIASNVEELLLYDPARRTSTRVRRNAPELERTGMTRLLFEP